jgi:pimeloyl-ACP methyl ester carboxylesterase
MRGYGQTDAPQEVDRYSLLHLLGDMVRLLDALGIERAVIAGHDWGAPGGLRRSCARTGSWR